MLSLVQKPVSVRRPVPLDRTELAAEWLMESGICGPGFGVAEEFRTDGTEYSPISMKATACYITTLLWLYETFGETSYIDRALTAAQYLFGTWQDTNGLVMKGGTAGYNRSAHRRLDEGGAMLRAMVESWRASQHAEFLAKAIEWANSMRRIPGLCPLGSARGWLALAQATGTAHWREPYDRAISWNLRFYGSQKGDQSEPWAAAANTLSSSSLTNRCSFLEALLANFTRPRKHAGENVRIFERVFQVTSDELLGLSDAPTETCARLLRLQLHATGLGLIKLDLQRAERTADLIRAMQADHADSRIHGGFYANRPSHPSFGSVRLTTTAVALQALAYWAQYQQGCFDPAPLDLV